MESNRNFFLPELECSSRQSFTVKSESVICMWLSRRRQSYILEVSHIHLCDWRRSLHGNSSMIYSKHNIQQNKQTTWNKKENKT